MWMSNITPPPSRVLPFDCTSSCSLLFYYFYLSLYILYGQDSGNNSEVDMEPHFLSLELPQSEVDESQRKPTTQVSYPFMLID